MKKTSSYGAFGVLMLMLILAAGCVEGEAENKGEGEARQRAIERADSARRIMTSAQEDAVLAEEKILPTSLRVGLWARRFLKAKGVEYRFGLAEGGYVAEGELIRDDRQDCVSLMYRVTELARADDHRDAVTWALDTRFAGAPLDSLVDQQGRVDYDNPAHLDFSLDMIRSGFWGIDISGQLTGATIDTVGSARYEPGSFTVVPEADLVEEELREGDIVWFVLDADHPQGGKLRREYGLVIGHIGIVIEEEGRPWLVHAASKGLEGWYEGGTVVSVPLAEYLDRVERYSAILVTRF
jgi:hypothetical protein